jgi:hypothetical protein
VSLNIGLARLQSVSQAVVREFLLIGSSTPGIDSTGATDIVQTLFIVKSGLPDESMEQREPIAVSEYTNASLRLLRSRPIFETD